MTKEQIIYLIEEHDFRWCEICDYENNRVFFYTTKETGKTQDLISKVTKFLERCPSNYLFFFKRSATDSNEDAHKYSYREDSQNLSPIVKNVDEKAIRDQILQEIKIAEETRRKEEELKEAYRIIEESKKESKEWGNKLLTVLEYAGVKLFEKYSPLIEQIINPTQKMALAGTPQNENKNIENTDSEMTPQKMVETGVVKLLQVITPDQFLKFANYIEAYPSIVKDPFVSQIFK